MNWSDTFRNRHYAPGYVYIAGSLEHRVLKIGTTVNIGAQEKRLRRTKYGSIGDWRLLYFVKVSEGGRIEHDARRILRRHQVLRMYDKEGHRQKAREMVGCRFGLALEAVESLLAESERDLAIRYPRSSAYEFGWSPPEPDPPPPAPLPTPAGLPPTIRLFRDIDQLDLSVLAYNFLKDAGIRYLGDLVRRSERELMWTPGLTRKALVEIKELLSGMGLSLGQAPSGWPPADLDARAIEAAQFLTLVDELDLTVRSSNCLKNSEIVYVGQLVQRTEADLIATPNFGRKSVNEVRDILAQMGLHLGTDLSRWPSGPLSAE
ncbi:hypothetical protein ACVILH_001521 [Bradyrhizobium sp. USDA 4353]